jgi:heterodisulfide reductase subunit C
MDHPKDCIQCGTCVDVCPAEMVGGHAIVTFLADPDAADYSVWLCTSCWRCQEACPSGVNVYELMMEQRRREQAPAGYQTAFDHVLDCGLALPVSQEELDQVRAAWGLERVELPSSGLVRVILCADK